MHCISNTAFIWFVRPIATLATKEVRIRDMSTSVRRQRHGRPLTKSKTFGPPRCCDRTEIKTKERARADKFNGRRDVIKEFGIRDSIREPIWDSSQVTSGTQMGLKMESGILGVEVIREIFAERTGSCGENVNIRGKASLSTGTGPGPKHLCLNSIQLS